MKKKQINNYGTKNSNGGKENRNGKPYKGKDRARDHKDRETPTDDKYGNVNDTSFYYSNPEILNEVTNIAFNEYLGVPLNYSLGGLTSKGCDVPITNMVSIYLNPSIQPTGFRSDVKQSAINITGYKNYLLLSANNAKTTSYAPQDVTCLILAIGSVISMYSFLKRPFGCVYLINQRNRSYPELLFKTMGIDFDDFKSNVADYRIKFNQLIAMFDRIPFFSDIPYFQKCSELYSHVYVDDDSPLAQTYMFIPASTWKINEAYDPNGTGLETTWVVPKEDPQTHQYVTRSYSEYLDIFQEMITRLATSTTFNAIFSDVLRVISNGKGSTLRMEVVPESYALTPIINQEIRHWINNMKIVHVPGDFDMYPSSAIITGRTNQNDVGSAADQNGVIYNPIFSVYGSDGLPDVNVSGATSSVYMAAATCCFERDVVNFDSMNPSIDDKVASTRLAVRGKVQFANAGSGSNGCYILNDIALGDFYCSGMKVFTDTTSIPKSIEDSFTITTNTTTCEGVLEAFHLLDKLKYAPRKMVFHSQTGSNTNYLYAMSGDLCYYTMLDSHYMKRLKDVESLTEFAINV